VGFCIIRRFQIRTNVDAQKDQVIGVEILKTKMRIERVSASAAYSFPLIGGLITVELLTRAKDIN